MYENYGLLINNDKWKLYLNKLLFHKASRSQKKLPTSRNAGVYFFGDWDFICYSYVKGSVGEEWFSNVCQFMGDFCYNQLKDEFKKAFRKLRNSPNRFRSANIIFYLPIKYFSASSLLFYKVRVAWSQNFSECTSIYIL